jgi:putative transposase
LHSWSFYQLKSFIAYKAQRAGVPLFEVDPRNTSRTCPACGCVDKRNRKTQSSFLCIVCGFAGLADYIASVNIGRRAQVNAPNVSIPVAIGSSNWSMAAVNQGQASGF